MEKGEMGGGRTRRGESNTLHVVFHFPTTSAATAATQQRQRQQCACSDGGNDHRCPQAERVGSEDALHFTVIDVNVLFPKEFDEIVVKRHFPALVRVSLSCVLV